MRLGRLTLVIGATIGLAFALRAGTPSVADYFAPPAYRAPKLAPGGGKLALIAQQEFRDIVLVLDLADMSPTPAATFTNVEVLDYWWKGEDWMIFLVRDFTGRFFRSVDLKSGKVHDQRGLNRTADHLTPAAGGYASVEIIDPMPADPALLLVAAQSSTGVELRRFNVRTGKSEVVEKNPGFVAKWIVNRAGQAVAALKRLDGNWFLLHRPSGEKRWREIPLGKRNVPDFHPVAVHDDGHRLIGWDYATADTARVVVRDIESGVDEVLFHSPDVDPTSLILWDDNRSNVRGIACETETLRFHYFNPADTAVAAAIDAALPGRTNKIISASADGTRLIIDSFSDTVPESYWLYDRAAQRLIPLGGARPALQHAELPSSRHFEFTARDGLKLRGRLYQPIPAHVRPAAVLFTAPEIQSRTRGGFHPYHQLIASRGYAVLTVDHRGTEGLGQKVATAGDKALDTLMADDLVDAVAYCAEQGWLDAKRVALLGQGHGGLLALSALARHPQAFAAWINLQTPLKRGAPTGTLLSGHFDFEHYELPFSQEREWRKYALQLEPAAWLREVRVPTFLYYPPDDHNHRGDLAAKELSRRGVPCVMVRRPGERHWSHTSWEELTRQRSLEAVRVYEEILRFLDRHLPSNS